MVRTKEKKRRQNVHCNIMMEFPSLLYLQVTLWDSYKCVVSMATQCMCNFGVAAINSAHLFLCYWCNFSPPSTFLSREVKLWLLIEKASSKVGGQCNITHSRKAELFLRKKFLSYWLVCLFIRLICCPPHLKVPRLFRQGNLNAALLKSQWSTFSLNPPNPE